MALRYFQLYLLAIRLQETHCPDHSTATTTKVQSIEKDDDSIYKTKILLPIKFDFRAHDPFKVLKTIKGFLQGM